jgi:hypothetical protein
VIYSAFPAEHGERRRHTAVHGQAGQHAPDRNPKQESGVSGPDIFDRFKALKMNESGNRGFRFLS